MRTPSMVQARIVLGLTTLLAMRELAGAEGRPEQAGGGLTLPQWEESASTGFSGSGLWPDDFNPALVIHPAIVSPAEADAAQEQAEEDSWLRFLPRGLLSRRKVQPALEPVLTDISPEALRAAENAPGDIRVLDPQGILGELQTEDLARLLAFHAEHAGVEARFLLLDAGQQLPPGADLSRIASGALAHGSACLVVYPLGAPRRARIFLTRAVSQVVEAAYLESLATACRRAAAEAPDPVEQLQRFATQLSIRLFWLERAYPAVKPEPVATVPLSSEMLPQAPVPSLSEIALPGPIAAQGRFSFDVFRRQWLPWIGLGCACLLIAGTILFMLVRWRRRRHGQTVWLLSDYDHRRPVRFGGPHCGGCGAFIKYG